MEQLLLCFLLLISCFSHAYCTKEQPYNAIFSFGNSYADTGNYITLVKGVLPYDVFEHLPYGMTYFGQPTGRGCDGRLVVDFIACKDYFRKSLFIFGEFGGNDYTFVLSAGKSISEVKSYVPVVINTTKEAAESLLEQGATTIVLPGNLPTGCIPIMLTLYASTNKSDYDHLGCLKHYNTIGYYHNIKLREAVVQLQLKYPKAKIIYGDYYEPVINFLKNPEKFGFTNGAPLKICCGGGGPYNYNLTATCGQPGVSACSNPSTYINWDGIHLTEAAYRTIATGWLKGPYAHPPILSGFY
ncbi:GDSL esterase/lipase [Rhynchospora pubera]|uniref:GDSL esterase/lipase n=1 Tax=Rhynchospora pubera TaxID=906938 RepID=A0AAV8FN28_9POAL|nr:GDSL esterase/lipase [Rhynchospora pubera]